MFLSKPPTPTGSTPEPPGPSREYLRRKELLELAGFSEEAAGLIASHREVRAFDAIDLLRKGCPQALVLRILL